MMSDEKYQATGRPFPGLLRDVDLAEASADRLVLASDHVARHHNVVPTLAAGLVLLRRRVERFAALLSPAAEKDVCIEIGVGSKDIGVLLVGKGISSLVLVG